jgi:hypothetical protein
MSDKAKVTLVDFSYDWPWYYVPPAGGAYVGVGATPEEAAEDALEQIAIDGHAIDERDVMDECPADDYDYDYGDEPDDGADGPYWYCAVRLQLDGE